MGDVLAFTAFEDTYLGAGVLVIGRDGVEACSVDYATLVELMNERLALMVMGAGSEPWRLRLTRLGLNALVAIELKLELDGADPE